MDTDPYEPQSLPTYEPNTQNTHTDDSCGIYWGISNGWSTETTKLGYPRPQNIPMIYSLTADKRQSLLKAYYSINPT